MRINNPRINQGFVPGHHGLTCQSHELAITTIVAAIASIISTPAGWRWFYSRDLIKLHQLVCDRIKAELDGFERGDSSDPLENVLFHALRPLVGDKRTLWSLKYDDCLLVEVSTLIHNDLFGQAERNGDQVGMDLLSEPHFAEIE